MPTFLRRLAEQVAQIMENDGGAKAIRTDWRQRVKVVCPRLGSLSVMSSCVGLVL